MAKFKDADGNEVEALTQAEVDAKLNEVKTQVTEELKQEYETKLNEQSDKMTQFEEEKAELERKIEEAGQKSGSQSENFKTLKDALNKKDEQIQELSKKIDDTNNVRVSDFREKLIEKYAKGDEELKKKIVHNYDAVLSGVKAVSEKEIETKIRSAVKLSVDENSPNPLDTVLSGGGAGYSSGVGKGTGDGQVEFTSKEKALGAKFGLTDDDYKKYGSKIK